MKNLFKNLWECFVLCCKIVVAYTKKVLIDCGRVLSLLTKIFCKYGKGFVIALYFAAVIGVCVRVVKLIGGV